MSAKDSNGAVANLKDIEVQYSKTKLRLALYHDEFKEKVINWSEDTLERRVKNEGFPATKEGHRWVISVKDMLIWFKKRGINL